MSNLSRPHRTQVIYIAHGGGPLPLLGEASHDEMIAGLHEIRAMLAKPAAIIIVSAHWEAQHVNVTAAKHPALLYDYAGFPPAAYQIQYPASGSPVLAERICGVLQKMKIRASLNEERSFDHGMFIPLKIMYPEADIPCVQVSLVASRSPSEHIQIGKALSLLKEENLLVIGSGFSFHNMRAFFSLDTQEAHLSNLAFEEWLVDTCSNRELSEQEREQRLMNWEKAPSARFCHPSEDHLLPLHVCYGVAQGPARQVFRWQVLGRQTSAYLW